MNRCTVLVLGAALALAPSLGGVSLSAAAPPNGGTIAIEPRTADGEYDPAMRAFVDGVGQAFTARGFTVLDDPAHAASILELTLSHADVGTALTRDPHPDKIGIGPGVIIPFSTGNSNETALQRTRLDLRILKRGEAFAVWTGAAVTVRAAGTREGAAQRVAADLSGALLSGYPAVPKDVIGVP